MHGCGGGTGSEAPVAAAQAEAPGLYLVAGNIEAALPLSMVRVDGSTVRVDGAGSAAVFEWAGGSARGVGPLAKDAAGNFYTPSYDYARGLVIRKITPQGVVTTRVYAGTSWEAGQRGDRVFSPNGFAMDGNGNTYLLSGRQYFGEGHYSGGAAIHRITSDGQMAAFAGSAEGTTGTVDGAGTAARFSANPSGAVVDGAGNLFVGDGNAVRKITPSGIVTTVARGFLESSPSINAVVWSLAIDPAGNLYAACSDFTLRKITAAGAVTISATGIGIGAGYGFISPAMATDETGNVYVGTGTVIQRVTPSGNVGIVAGVPEQLGIRLGPLPASLYGPGGMVYAGDRTLVVTSGGAVLRLVLP